MKSTAKRNSGGIIIYIKNCFVSEDSLIFTSQDDIIWVKIAASKLSIDKDFYVGLCYVLPDDSSRQSLTDNNIFDRLIDSCFFHMHLMGQGLFQHPHITVLHHIEPRVEYRDFLPYLGMKDSEIWLAVFFQPCRVQLQKVYLSLP